MVTNHALKISDVVFVTKLSESTIYRMIKNKEFPSGTSVGKSKLWLSNQINDWMFEKFGGQQNA